MTPTRWLVVILLVCCASHARSLNLNRPSGRWARNEGGEGWRAATAPLNKVHPTDAATTPFDVLTARSDDGAAFLPVAASEGFYELVVGKKSSQAANGEEASHQSSLSGPPDAKDLGRVTPTEVSDTPVTGQSQFPSSQSEPTVSSPSDPMETGGEPANTDDGDDDWQPGTLDDTLVKKQSQPALPPGSFYLPAVSSREDQYYSSSEHAIYIPLHRPETAQPYPVGTHVVLVDKKANPSLLPPTAPTYIHKEDDGENSDEPTDSDDDQEEETDQSEEEPPVPLPPKAQLDLVMTVYPNLPKLLPHQSPVNLGISSVRAPNRPPIPPSVRGQQSLANNHLGSMSVIHEVKVVSPPQGYLPQLLTKLKASIGNRPGNSTLTQLKPAASAVAPVKLSPPVQPNAAKPALVSGTPVKAPPTAPVPVPFTADDISPLNFVNRTAPALAAPQTSTERIVTDQQPNHHHQSLTSSDQTIEATIIRHAPSQKPLTHPAQSAPPTSPLFDAPKHVDYAWNVSAPPSGLALTKQQIQQPSQPLKSPPQHPQPQQQPLEQPKLQQLFQQPLDSQGSSHQLIIVPGDSGEVVVRTSTKFGPNSGGSAAQAIVPVYPLSSPDQDSVEIITGRYEEQPVTDRPTDLVKYVDHQPHAPKQQPQQLLGAASQQNHQIAISPGLKGMAVTSERPTEAGPSTKPQEFRPSQLHADFMPMVDAPTFAVSSGEQGLLKEDERFLSVVPPPALSLVETQKKTDHELAAPPTPDYLSLTNEDQHTAESKINQQQLEKALASDKDPSTAQVQPVKQQPEGIGSAATSGSSGKPSKFYYKVAKMSPKGAMYTLHSGHSKVKFFGYNHLASSEDKYGLYLQSSQHQQDLQQPGWKFSPYLPGKVPSSTLPTVKAVPKKSVAITSANKNKLAGQTTIRPVYFAKRPSDAETAGEEQSWSPSISISDPFEYHVHLKKMAEDRLPVAQQQ